MSKECRLKEQSSRDTGSLTAGKELTSLSRQSIGQKTDWVNLLRRLRERIKTFLGEIKGKESKRRDQRAWQVKALKL